MTEVTITHEDGVWTVSWTGDPMSGAICGNEQDAIEHAEWLRSIMKMADLIPGAMVHPAGRDVEDLELVMPGIGTIDLSTFTPEHPDERDQREAGIPPQEWRR